MKRPFGVIFSAVVLLLGTLFQLLMAFVMAFSGAFMPMQTSPGGLPGASATTPVPPWMSTFMYLFSFFCLTLAIWGIVTTVGLFRLRNWARYSVLVIGGGIALIGLVSMLTSLLLIFIPMPLPPSAGTSQPPNLQVFVKVIFAVTALLYGIVGGIGVYWLVYFNLKRVRAIFAGAAVEFAGAAGQFPGGAVQLAGASTEFAVALPQSRQNPRPFLVSLLAVLNLIGAGSCLLMALFPIPAVFVGMILHGWEKSALYLIFAAIQAAVGVGLWRLDEWGRRLALAMTVFGAVQCGVYVFRPSLLLRYNAEMKQMMGFAQPELPARLQNIMYSSMFGFSVLFCIAIAAVLLYYRTAFHRHFAAGLHQSALPR